MLEDWANFFIAQVGAAAALTGLLFVGVSINLSKIIGYGNLTIPALQALMLLVEVLAVAIFFWVATTPSQLRAARTVEAQFKSRQWLNLVAGQVAMLPFFIAGVLLVVGKDWGLYWIVPGVILCVSLALMDSWVLLIEINR